MPSSEVRQRLRALQFQVRYPVRRPKVDIRAELKKRAVRMLTDGQRHAPDAIRWAQSTLRDNRW